MNKQRVMFETEVTTACDDVIEAVKAKKDADDRVECTRKHLAKVLKSRGLGNKDSISHDGHTITLKEFEIKEDTITIKKEKEKV